MSDSPSFLTSVFPHGRPWLVFWFLLVWVGFPLAAQPKIDTLSLHFKRLDAKDGLSQGLVMGIVQDPEGFMWFATGDGLNRYDGYQMKVYRHNPADSFSLPENSVTGLAFDENGNFWISTSTKGLWRMDRKTERFTSFRNSNAAGGTISFMTLVDGWLLLVGRGVVELLDVRKVKPETRDCPIFKQKGVLQGELEHFQLMPGPVVLGRKFVSGTISRWIPSGKTLIEENHLFPISSTNRANQRNWCCDSDRKLFWVISDDRLFRLDENWKSTLHMLIPKSLADKLIQVYPWSENELLMDVYPEGSHWLVNTESHKVSRVISNHPSRAPITKVFKDRAGNKWLGTGGEGVSMLPAGSGKFQTWTRDRYIYQLAKSPKEEIVFYDQTSTIWINPKTRTRRAIKFHQGLRMENMIPMVYAPSGLGWIGYTVNEQSTLLVPDQPSVKPIHIPPMKEKSWSGEPFLFIDSLNYFWRIESANNNQRFLRVINLSNLKDEQVYQMPISSRLHSMPLVSAVQQIENTLWLGTTQGLFYFDMKARKWRQHYQNQKGNPASLSNDLVLSMCPDPLEPSRFLWVGTMGGGLNRVELATGKCRSFSMNDGLPNDVVYGILSDEYHNLWLSTNKGLCCFTPPKTEKEPPRCRNFTTEDGLANDEFNRYSYTKMADGRLVFGGTNGLTWFYPKEVLATGNPPQMAITGFSIFNSPIDFRSDSSVVKAPFPFAKQIDLNHEQDMFRIDFASLDFGPNAKKQYSYFLEGYDKKWIPGGTSNSATYTNLDPGEYTFRVKGTNSDGVWSTMEAAIHICISPPWWATWWFRTLAGLSVCGMVYGVYRYQLSQAIKVIKLRNRIALDLHDEIGSTLNSIAFFGEVANQMMEENDQAKPVLSRMSTHAKEVVESMSDIVWSLNSKNDSMESIIDRLQSFAIHLLEPKGCAVEFHRPDTQAMLKMDMERRRNLYLIVKEAINNSAKYAGASRLWVHFQFTDQRLDVEVGDNGKGFDQNKVAEGNGLGSMQDRAVSMGAKLRFETREGEGTRIFLGMKI